VQAVIDVQRSEREMDSRDTEIRCCHSLATRAISSECCDFERDTSENHETSYFRRAAAAGLSDATNLLLWSSVTGFGHALRRRLCLA